MPLMSNQVSSEQALEEIEVIPFDGLYKIVQELASHVSAVAPHIEVPDFNNCDHDDLLYWFIQNYRFDENRQTWDCRHEPTYH